MSAFELFTNEFQQLIPQASISKDINALQNYIVDGVSPRAVVTPTTIEEAALTVALVNKYHLSLFPRSSSVRMNLLQYPETDRGERESLMPSAAQDAQGSMPTMPGNFVLLQYPQTDREKEEKHVTHYIGGNNGKKSNTSSGFRGSPDGFALGGIPEPFDVLLLTNKLDRLLEYEAPDLTCCVEAGMTLAVLQAQLATKGQRLALDPPAAEQVTIGGLLATNASGPKRLRYGTARDLVIGLSVIQASGEIARSGGRVVKNVAGYDLNKLYIGSLGTLGVIVEANFKLHPLPSSERTLLLTFVTLQDTMQTAITITGSLLQPTALELIDAKAASAMSSVFGLNLPTNGYTLAVNFEGSPRSIERQMDETRLLARRNNALIGEDLEGDEQLRFWNIVRAHTQGTLTCKISLKISQVAGYLNDVAQICSRYNLEAAVIGHIGNGILYIELSPSAPIQELVAAIEELRAYAQAAHGHLVVERCPVDLKRRVSVWGEPGRDFYMMQRLKERFDPRNTFVRGRFLGGL